MTVPAVQGVLARILDAPRRDGLRMIRRPSAAAAPLHAALKAQKPAFSLPHASWVILDGPAAVGAPPGSLDACLALLKEGIPGASASRLAARLGAAASWPGGHPEPSAVQEIAGILGSQDAAEAIGAICRRTAPPGSDPLDVLIRGSYSPFFALADVEDLIASMAAWPAPHGRKVLTATGQRDHEGTVVLAARGGGSGQPGVLLAADAGRWTVALTEWERSAATHRRPGRVLEGLDAGEACEAAAEHLQAGSPGQDAVAAWEAPDWASVQAGEPARLLARVASASASSAPAPSGAMPGWARRAIVGVLPVSSHCRPGAFHLEGEAEQELAAACTGRLLHDHLERSDSRLRRHRPPRSLLSPSSPYRRAAPL